MKNNKSWALPHQNLCSPASCENNLPSHRIHLFFLLSSALYLVITIMIIVNSIYRMLAIALCIWIWTIKECKLYSYFRWENFRNKKSHSNWHSSSNIMWLVLWLLHNGQLINSCWFKNRVHECIKLIFKCKTY